MADYDRLFMAEELRLDGSNFIEWYLLLCEVIHANDLLDVLEEPIGDKSTHFCKPWSGFEPPT